MKSTQELTSFWNWLPAFRVVAETEHLPSASKLLHLTPSALSRTIRLLEDVLGEELFQRKGRGLVLSPAGEGFLNTVRHAMRTVHDGMLAVQSTQRMGPVHICAPAPFAAVFLLPALQKLQEREPGLLPSLHTVGPRLELNQQLRQGTVDLALLDDPIPDPELTIHPLMRLHHDVYCSSDHEFAQLDSHEVCERLPLAPFVAPIADGQGQTPDAWPMGRPRNICMRVTQMNVALSAIQTGGYVAILPIVVGQRSPGLVRLQVSDLMPTTLFMVHRPPLNVLPEASRVELLIQEIERVVQDVA